MRELLFSIEYGEGADPLMDVFREHGADLSADGIASCIGRDRSWLIERFEGPSSALDRIERIRCEPQGPREEMTEHECGADVDADRLERSPTTMVIHTFVERLHTCNSVLALASRYLDLGFVIQTRRRDSRHEFRLLLRSDENVDVYCDEVPEHLGDGITFRFGRLGDAEWWSTNSLSPVTLPQEQRETLRRAVNEGYYETPREVTVSELADELGIPQSTASYRLRQAEARLAKGYQNRFETQEIEEREPTP